MQSHLLALSRFTIFHTDGLTQNLRTFVILLHDYPLKVENTELYNLVKTWRTPKDVKEALETHGFELPNAFPLHETDTVSAQFFKQSYYKTKPKEEVKLLCWG